MLIRVAIQGHALADSTRTEVQERDSPFNTNIDQSTRILEILQFILSRDAYNSVVNNGALRTNRVQPNN